MGSASNPGGVGAGSADEGHVHRAAAHPLDEPVRVVLNQGEVDPGMGAVEGGQRVEQRGDGARRDHADHQSTADEPVHLVHRLAYGLDGRQHGPRLLERGGAGGRQARRAAGPVEERRTEVLLELADLRADTGLADVDTRRGAVKFASSATATKYSSCLSSITDDSSNHLYDLLDF